MENLKRINIAMDETLHRKLKIAVATDNTTVKEYVITAIQEKLERGNENEKGKKNERKHNCTTCESRTTLH